ncbi:Ger(x)C family spore germination C-terminal domain-containing protein [Paenibacillus sp. FSL M7-0896]|uniref:Ger(x)C family spore germination C-terminal domain-containing protein n=1 Tax=Paenibacillus sp. FSL M7-0896 TaxID=2921610 RepID=UPI0030DC7C8A
MIGKVKSTVGKVECPDAKGDFVMEVLNAESKITPHIKDGEPSVTVEIRIEANVAEVECNLDLESREGLRAMKELAIQKHRN